MKSLAEFLGVEDPKPEPEFDLIECKHFTAKEFCEAVVNSREFRQYIMNGIRLGDIPPQIMGRIIDHGWGKPPDRVEHTGKDGSPIVTEIRRVIINMTTDIVEEIPDVDVPNKSIITH